MDTYDINYNILLQIDNIPDLKNFCKSSSLNSVICKENLNIVCQGMLKNYQVDYTDPTNFIYVYNNVKQNDYKNNQGWLYKDLFKLYMRHFYKTEIRRVGRVQGEDDEDEGIDIDDEINGETDIETDHETDDETEGDQGDTDNEIDHEHANITSIPCYPNLVYPVSQI